VRQSDPRLARQVRDRPSDFENASEAARRETERAYRAFKETSAIVNVSAVLAYLPGAHVGVAEDGCPLRRSRCSRRASSTRARTAAVPSPSFIEVIPYVVAGVDELQGTQPWNLPLGQTIVLSAFSRYFR
jgi:hypothetical protein